MAKVKQSKATKKFEKNNLTRTLELRKDSAKIKQRHQVKEKKKRQAERRTDKAKDEIVEKDADQLRNGSEGMNNDKFFQDPLQIPQVDEVTVKATKKRLQLQSGKRKRSDEPNEDEASIEKLPIDDQDAAHLLESGSEIDEEDHRGQLDALAEKDPDFYKYLQENDAELLEFNEDNNLDEIDALGTTDDDERPLKKRKAKSKHEEEASMGVTTVSSAQVNKWHKSMSENHSLRALRQVVLAFRAAAHINDEDGTECRYSIPNPDIYHEVLMTALNQIPSVLKHHLPVKESAAGKLRIPTESQKFRTLSPLIKSHASSLHHLLINLSDAATLKLTLQSFEPILPYLLQYRKFLKLIIKSVVSLWANNSSAEASRVTAFLLLRRLMVLGDAGIREAILRSVYEGIVKGSRNTTIHTLAGVNLMKNSAAEIWGIDQKVGYTAGFTFIRQLAIHLRGNITKPTKDSYKTIYNWQYIHSLDFWSRVLSMHCNSLVEAESGKESQFRPLIYPVVQITLGVMRLIPTSTYFPLRFQLTRALLRISQATSTYIPLASALLEVLNAAEMKKPPKPATLRPLDFDSNLRAPTSYLKTRIYQDGVGEQVIELFSEFFVLWSKSIAFPELLLPLSVMLKRWLRSSSSKTSGNKNAKVNQGLLLLLQKAEANSRWIEERRNKVTFAPKDRADIDGFLKDVGWEETPFGAFVVDQRKMKSERKKILDQAQRVEDKRSKSRPSDEKVDDHMDDAASIAEESASDRAMDDE